MTQRRIALRGIACSVGLGAGWGTVGAGVVLTSLQLDETEKAGIVEILGVLLMAAVYGGMFGSIVGFVVGIPTVLVVMCLRSDLPSCRVVGAVVASVLPAGAAALAVQSDGPEALVVFGPLILASAWSAWFGLGWIFRPADQPASGRMCG